MSEESSIEEMLANGTLSKKDYMDYKNYKAYLNELNNGYAFVTFSYSDEAKLAIAMGSGNMMIDGNIVNIDLKRDYVDHKDFD